MSRKNVNRIMAVYNLATTQERIDGASWYETAYWQTIFNGMNMILLMT